MAEKRGKGKKRYLAYLLRVWQEYAGDVPGRGGPGGNPPLWRASLERPREGQRLGFASLVDLYAFLDRETGSGSPGPERRNDDEGQRRATAE